MLLDRLAALEMMLLQKPIVSGRYSSVIHNRYMLPLQSYYDFTLRRWPFLYFFLLRQSKIALTVS